MAHSGDSTSTADGLVVENSCGVIVVCDKDRVLLVHEPGGAWGCPKGHRERGESEIEAALREVREETGLEAADLKLVPGFRECTEYVPRRHPRTLKKLVLFAATLETGCEGAGLRLETKLMGHRWCGLRDGEAESVVTYPEVREILTKLRKRVFGSGRVSDPGFWPLLAFSASLFMTLATPLVPHSLDRLIPLGVDGVSWHELLDMVFGPLMAVTAMWLHVVLAPGARWTRALMVAAVAVTMEGHGVHTAANTIHQALGPLERWSSTAWRPRRVAYWIDEVAGHHLLFGGMVSCLLLLLVADHRKGRRPFWSTILKRQVVCALLIGAVQGVGFFFAIVEGQTVLTLGIPCCVIALLDAVAHCRTGGVVCWATWSSSLVCLCVTLAWGHHFNWTWPEFRVLGLGFFSSWPGQLLHWLRTSLFSS